MSDRFRKACNEINGIFSEQNNTKICKVGSEEIDTLVYSPNEETAVIKDHQGREKKIDKIDKISRGTNWINIERPDDPIMITSVKGDVELHDFREE